MVAAAQGVFFLVVFVFVLPHVLVSSFVWHLFFGYVLFPHFLCFVLQLEVVLFVCFLGVSYAFDVRLGFLKDVW